MLRSSCMFTGYWWNGFSPSTWSLTTWKLLREWSVFTICMLPWTQTLSSMSSMFSIQTCSRLLTCGCGNWILFLDALRALNEMWKCQNLLRQHVKDLLELVKKPKVTNWNVQWNTAAIARRGLQILTAFSCPQSEASSKAVFAKVMVITSKRPQLHPSAKFKQNNQIGWWSKHRQIYDVWQL